MNEPSDKFDEVVRLLLEANSGTASDGDLQQLNQLLRDDPELRRRTAKHLQDEALLREELAIAEAGELFKNDVIFPNAAKTMVTPASTRQSLRGRFPLWVGVLAASLLIALVANFALMWRNNDLDNGSAVKRPDQQEPALDPIVGTLTHAADCNWHQPLSVGDHLTAGKVRLDRGLARVDLSNGVVLIIQGPADLRLASADHIVVNRGNVIANVNEEAIGFRLETPTTSVIDVGTEFSVSVNEAGHSEVQVLEGAVTCLPRAGDVEQNPPLFTVGSATIFESKEDTRGRPVASRAKELRELRRSVNAASTDGDGRILAYEGFDYPLGQIGGDGGGIGWKTPWLLGFRHSEASNVVIRRGQNLQPPNWLGGDAATYSVQPTGSLARRTLASPLDLSVDADYYISFLIQKRIVGSTDGEKAGGGVTLFAANDKNFGMAVSIDSREYVTCWTGQQRYVGGVSVPPDKTYFVVVKIAARRADPDNVMARIFSSNHPPEIIEPKAWDSAGQAAKLDGTLDVLTTWSGESSVTLIDEIRVGTTWNSVVPLR